MPNVLITPHVAATTWLSAGAVFEFLRAQVLAHLAGQPLRNIVDKSAGY